MAKDDDIGMEDIFVNFKNVQGAFGDPVTTVHETVVDTALAIGGQRAWAIQEIEPFFPLQNIFLTDWKTLAVDYVNAVSLGIGRPGIASMGDDGRPPPPGMLAQWQIAYGTHITVEGVGAIFMEQPRVWRPATAVPYARNKISLYCEFQANVAAMVDVPIAARISFTYIPVTDKLYREINERWALD